MNPALVSKTTKSNGENGNSSRDSIKNLCKKFESGTKSQQLTKKTGIENVTMKLPSSNISKEGGENLMRKETKTVNSRIGADKKAMKRSPPQKLATKFREGMMMAATSIANNDGIGTSESPHDSRPSPSVASLSAKFASSSNSYALDSSASTFSTSSSAYPSTASVGLASIQNNSASPELANSPLNTSNDDSPSSSSTVPMPNSNDSIGKLKPPSTKPKPKIPPKPPKFANSFGKKAETNGSNAVEINEIGTQKLETSKSTTMATNSESSPAVESNLESSLRPFSRANSIRRPKCKPPNPVESSSGPSKCAEVTKTEQSKIVRKPSSRPPPPPIQKDAANKPNFARGSVVLPPSLPSNPPPPPPVQTQICQNPCKIPLATSVTGSIYEEIECGDHFEEERETASEWPKQGGNYTPKFRKKDGLNNGANPREWANNRGKGRAQRRRTTQLDNVLWDGHTEEAENGEDNFDEFAEGNSIESKNGFAASINAQNHPSSSSPLCRSLFVSSSSSSGEFGRIGAGLKQNLAKGMGKLRSRVSAFTSVHQSPSTVAKTFIQDNFRTLTLGRTKSERMPGIGANSKLADRRGRALSTFYLEGERSSGQTKENPQNQLEFEENSSAELFGDDWSSSEEEDEEEATIEEQKTTGLEEDASPSIHQQPKQQPIPPQHPAFIPDCQSQSLLAEIESEYQRLQLGRKKRKEEEEERKLLESGKQIEESKMPTTTSAADHQTTTSNSESPSSPPIPSSSFNSSLPDRQPLYQIYLLQREQQRLNKFVAGTNAGEEAATAGVLLEPIGEIPLATKILALEKEKSGSDEVDSVCCPDTSGESEGSAGSTSAHHSLVRRNSSSTTADSGRADSLPLRPLRRDRERLLGQSVYGSQRSLWCELPEVKESGLLERMDDEQKKQQEAYFEVITSEASYLRSISFLISHFMSAPEFSDSNKSQKFAAISYADKKQLFSNILAIRDCSERLLSELEQRMKQAGLVLTDICDILCTHFESHFEPYVNYCSNQVYQDRTLRKLKTDCPAFIACVQRLEADRQCQGLDMRSFLMLPMQRITRYPLLIEAILIWLQPDQRQHSVATRALTLANQVVRNCNEGARRMERTEQLLDIESRLVYKCAELKRIALVSNGRYVVKSGQLIQLAEKTIKPKLGPGRGLKARPLAFFLFNDLVLVAKRRMNGQFVCKDYAFRRFVVLEPMEPSNLRVPPGIQSALGGRSPHLLSCILLQNARGRQAELLLTAESESDRERWLSAFRPPSCANPDEKIYAEWDCPQALAVHSYEATQADELSLCPGDLVNILRKMSDGWFYGERLRDKKGGWFPSSYVQQVMNDHVRAQNYRERLRIMQSASEFRTIHQTQQQGGKRASLAAAPFSSSIASSSPHSSTSQQESPQILSRFRRLSNPRAYFSRLE